MAEIIRRPERPEGREGLMPSWGPLGVMRELLRWDPFHEMQRLLPSERQVFSPDFEVKETRDAYVFCADLPGVKQEALDVTVTGNRVTISGKREEDLREGETYYACERPYGSFTRSFTIPEDADIQHASAELKDGILVFRLPKSGEVRPKKIPIGGKPQAKA